MGNESFVSSIADAFFWRHVVAQKRGPAIGTWEVGMRKVRKDSGDGE